MTEQTNIKINKAHLENLKRLYGQDKSYNEILEIVCDEQEYIMRTYSFSQMSTQKAMINLLKKMWDLEPKKESETYQERYDKMVLKIEELTRIFNEKHSVR